MTNPTRKQFIIDAATALSFSLILRHRNSVVLHLPYGIEFPKGAWADWSNHSSSHVGLTDAMYMRGYVTVNGKEVSHVWRIDSRKGLVCSYDVTGEGKVYHQLALNDKTHKDWAKLDAVRATGRLRRSPNGVLSVNYCGDFRVEYYKELRPQNVLDAKK